MIRYECDLCGVSLPADSAARFVVRMEIFAAAGPIELDADRPTDPGSALQTLIEKLRTADPDQVEDRTYRAFRFDVCDPCRATLINNPLGRPRE